MRGVWLAVGAVVAACSGGADPCPDVTATFAGTAVAQRGSEARQLAIARMGCTYSWTACRVPNASCLRCSHPDSQLEVDVLFESAAAGRTYRASEGLVASARVIVPGGEVWSGDAARGSFTLTVTSVEPFVGRLDGTMCGPSGDAAFAFNAVALEAR